MQDPRNIWIWFALGHSLEQTEQLARAAESYSACIALNPDYFGWFFNRGRVRLKTGEYALARDDFLRSIELNPKHAESQVNLAITYLELKDFEKSIRAIELATQLGFVDSQAYFLLSQAYAGQGNSVAAQEARQKAEQTKPTRAASWIARGVSHAKSEPRIALADFDEALNLNAHLLAALESKASVLSESLNRTQDAIAVLDDAIRLFPEESQIRACRGVLHARLNQSQPARDDANQAMAMNPSPAIQYQVAGIFALLATDSPRDGQRAIDLLAKSLKQGYGSDLLDTDPDLAPIRDLPEFKRLREAARVIDSKVVE